MRRDVQVDHPWKKITKPPFNVNKWWERGMQVIKPFLLPTSNFDGAQFTESIQHRLGNLGPDWFKKMFPVFIFCFHFWNSIFISKFSIFKKYVCFIKLKNRFHSYLNYVNLNNTNFYMFLSLIIAKWWY